MGSVLAWSEQYFPNSGENDETAKVALVNWRMKRAIVHLARGRKVPPRYTHRLDSETNNRLHLGHGVLGISLKKYQ